MTSSRAARPPVGAAIIGIAVGGILLAGGVFLAWVMFATPVVTGLTATPARPGPGQLAIGAAVWGVALVAPPCFAIVGALRLGRVARSLTVKPGTRAVTRSGTDLGDEYVSAFNVRLPDGRIVRDLVLGPFGLAVISELPPERLTRHSGMSWEIRRADGRWSHFENPLDRATRDSERVRRWVASTDRDYVVKVYAAVVTADPTVSRTPACAVVTSDEIAPWLLSLPPARALNPDRRAELVSAVQTLL